MRCARIALMAFAVALLTASAMAESAAASTTPSVAVNAETRPSLAFLPGSRPVSGPTESLDPDTGSAGDVILARGTGFPTGTAECALFLQQSQIATCAVAADGTWSGSFTIPDVPAEIAAIVACADCAHGAANLTRTVIPRPHAQADLTILPRLRTNHLRAAGGSTLLAHGDGFRGDVSFFWSDSSAAIAHASAQPDGEVDTTVTVPATGQFPFTLRACDNVDRRAVAAGPLLDQCASATVDLLVTASVTTSASATTVAANGNTTPTPPPKRASFDALAVGAAALGILAAIIALLAGLTFRRRLRRRSRPASHLQIRCVAGETAISLRVQLLDRDGLRILMERDTPGVVIRGVTP
jgi:hypothetical protein